MVTKKEKWPKFKFSYREENKGWIHLKLDRAKPLPKRFTGANRPGAAYFTIQYGSDLVNKSVSYELPEEKDKLIRDWRIFTSDKEIEFMMSSA